VEKFSKIVLISIFTALIVGSIQNALAEDITDMFKPVPIKNAEYQFHLQAVLRDTDGRLITVTESTNGYYIPHDITDQSFDKCFGANICKKEIVVIDNKKYEKIQFTDKFSLEVRSALMFFLIAKLSITDGDEITFVDAPVFQAFVPLVYLEEDNVIHVQWTIFRELN
jgi:hypothetical protein